MDSDEGFDDEGPFSPWVPPDDRLWRHPSESAGAPTRPFALHQPAPRTLPTRTWGTALVAGLVGAILASGIGIATGGFGHTTVIRPAVGLVSPTTAPTEAASLSTGSQAPTASWSSVYDQLAPSMVTVTGSGDAGEVAASGMLWKTTVSGQTAYILAADSDLQGMRVVSVTFTTNTSVPGKVVGTDPQTGLAVISVPQRRLPAGGFAFPTLAPLTDVHVADSLAAVTSGSATSGSGQSGSFAVGAVSSLDQFVDDPTTGLGMLGMIAVSTAGQVDTGAALVEASGAVVGLTVGGGQANGQPQVSYGVPMDIASTIATQLVNGQRPWHPWIGVLEAADLPATAASRMGLSGGAQVQQVSPGSPAAQAGLGPSDVIVSLDNTTINSTGNLLDALERCSDQSRVPLRYLDQRTGKPVTTSITITAQPTDPADP